MTAAANEKTAFRGGGSLVGPPLAATVNHLLRSASWAREQLKPFAGKTLRFDVAPLNATLQILDNGEVCGAVSAEPDARFKLTPALGLRIAAADPAAWRDVEASGDMALAREVLTIAQNLRWDYEEDLSRLFGDIVAHRLAGAGRAFVRWQQDAVRSLAQQASAYWTEERPVVAARELLEQFGHDVDTLRDDVARLEKRLAALAAPGNGKS